jgi:hypothetical protein
VPFGCRGLLANSTLLLPDAAPGIRLIAPESNVTEAREDEHHEESETAADGAEVGASTIRSRKLTWKPRGTLKTSSED